jgi:PTH1 family peptidyl-tRNA hydrolase
MHIIVGLGNPGDRYQNNRHNVGFMALDWLRGDVSWKHEKKFRALTYENGDRIYVKPQTFMNDSGEAVRAIMSYYGLLPKTLGLFNKKGVDLNGILTVIQDDIDIELGKWKMATDSRSGGHRGIQSIINQLKTQKFRRLKIGVKNELLRTRIPAEKFVLQSFGHDEKIILEETVRDALRHIG